MTAQVFLSYARPDAARFEALYDKLLEAGYRPWMDTRDLAPGELWDHAIAKALSGSDFFLACLSKNSVEKRGYLQREIRKALDIRQEKLDEDIYLIPVRLEDCPLPDRLREFHWLDLFAEDGWPWLKKTLEVGLERMGRGVAEKPDWAEQAGRDEYGRYADFRVGDEYQRMRWIEPGEFLMGSPPDEPGRFDWETQHRVILTQGYWLADTACTQGLWEAVMGNNFSRFKGAGRPVENVSWNDVQVFMERLNERLPGAGILPADGGAVGVRLSGGDDDAVLVRPDDLDGPGELRR